ncbi:MAG: TlpA family protein disulfide reductase [Chloroflexi bacterium]|nr:TlpA family protein disulfide reductase [Chloroflexota bacterium]
MAIKHQYKPKQKPNKLYLLMALIFFIGGLTSLLWMRQNTRPSYPAPTQAALQHQGQASMEFTLSTLNQGDVSLSDYDGQVVVMNMWATWCPPCRAEMPELNRFYETHKNEGLVVLAVNAQEDEKTVRPFIELNNFTFPVLLDLDGDVASQYLTRSFPTTYVIDRNGRIQHIQVGEITEQQLDEIVLPLLQ